MKRSQSLLLACGLLTFGLQEKAASQLPFEVTRSPDGTGAVIIRRKSPEETGESERTDFRQFGKLVARYEFTSLRVINVRWSPDSLYCVFTTTSSGGHSPWHFPSFVFSRHNHSIKSLDDTVGAIIKPDIRFNSPHTVILTVHDRSGIDLASDAQKQIKVNLNRVFD
jgi:hypothetical protein